VPRLPRCRQIGQHLADPGENLKPRPEQGEATTICGWPGSVSSTKSPSSIMA
jgi:hypothetical protein